jgi:uncharacterized protein (TIGR03032 family)
VETESKPFACTFTPDVPGILSDLGCTLVLSTYQAGKVILLSAGPNGLVQLPRTFAKPMGMTLEARLLAIATRDEVVVLANSRELAPTYPEKPGTYDGMFVPRAVYFTGELDIHDMGWGTDGLWAVTTRMSCLSLIDHHYNIRPVWRPPFVSGLVPEDRCHLNGLAMVGGKPEWVTALGRTNAAGAWREGRLERGVLMHVATGEVAIDGLGMPHSPRVYDGSVFFLNSSTGELCRADPGEGRWSAIARFPGFLRGLARLGPWLFVGMSRVRRKHLFSGMPVAERETHAGIGIVHLPSGRTAGIIRYHSSCEEIYDVQVLPGLVRPNILNHTTPTYRRALVTPTESFWAAEGSPEAAPGGAYDVES